MALRLYAWTFAAVLSLTLASCSGHPVRNAASISTESTTAAPTASDPAVQSGNPPIVAESDSDPTLYPDEYEARGVPSIQNPWTANDYQLAVKAFEAIAKENPALLPRASSQHSGTVFRRMVSRENLHLYSNRDINWNVRMTSLSSIIEAMPIFMVLYGNALLMGQRLDREVLEIYLQSADCALVAWQAMDEVTSAIDKNDPRHQARMAAIEETQDGTANLIRGMVLALMDRQYVSIANHVRYSGELVAILPGLIDRLKPPIQAEVKERIAHLAASEPEPELAKQLKLLSKAVSTVRTTPMP